jgi:hypothetical protein
VRSLLCHVRNRTPMSNIGHRVRAVEV